MGHRRLRLLPRRRAVILIAWVLAAPLAAADWTVDVGHSIVRFHGSSTLHDFDGTAKLVSGTLHLDGGQSFGTVVADAASMDTAESGRDRTMRSETMEVQTWPVIRFDLTGFQAAPPAAAIPATGAAPAGASAGTGSGTWTMHGVAQPITIPVTIDAGSAPHLHAHVVLDIRTWKIKPPRAMLVITVDPQVTVDLDLALVPGTPPGPASATAATAAAPGLSASGVSTASPAATTP